MIQLPANDTTADITPPMIIPNNWLEKKLGAGAGLTAAMIIPALVRGNNTYQFSLSISLLFTYIHGVRG